MALTPTGNLSFHHGLIGASYDVLFGKKFSAFDKIGYKFRPFGITYKKVNASFTVRWYPNGFTADEFGNAEPRLENVNRKSEVLYGATIENAGDGRSPSASTDRVDGCAAVAAQLRRLERSGRS